MKKLFCFIIAYYGIYGVCFAQIIPNAGFETWYNMGTYSNPTSWGSLNNKTAIDNVFTCEMGTPGAPGASFIKLISKTIPGGVAPGIAVCGQIDTLTFLPKSGFPFSGRPSMLTGKWQYMDWTSSVGFVEVKLTRWDGGSNSRVSVATVRQFLVGMEMSWVDFSIPLIYTDNNAPDTCIITLSASGAIPANLDFLWVDSLSFSGSVGISENSKNETIEVYPNPSSSSLTIDLSALNNREVKIQIMDLQGRVEQRIENKSTLTKMVVNIGDFSKGIYFIDVISKDATIRRKFIKQ